MYFKSYTQNVFQDSISQEMIPLVEIYGEKGNFIGNTHADGTISDMVLKKIKECKTSQLILYHIAYEQKVVDVETFLSSKHIKLIPRTIFLQEVSVGVPQNFLNLKVYYRSYQIDDGEVTLYADGIADYFFPLKTQFENYVNLLEYRFMELKKEEKKKNKKTKPIAAGVPFIFVYFPSQDSLTFEKPDSLTNDIYYNKRKIGSLKEHPTNPTKTFEINMITPNRPQKMTISNVLFRSFFESMA